MRPTDHRPRPAPGPVSTGRRALVGGALALVLAAPFGGRARSHAGNGAAVPALPLPAGPTILSLHGKIGLRNTPEAAVFDDALLGSLPQHSFRTGTIWTSAPHEFSGPALRDVIDRVRGRGGRLIAEAANRYRVALDTASLEPAAPIVARRIDGRPFGLRQRGPLWIMFPFDTEPRFRSETIYSQCVWHLVSLTLARGGNRRS